MRKWSQFFSSWLPAVLVMVAIFLFSAQPSSALPDFDWLDRFVKKGGHIVGYALLTLAYWRGLRYRADKRWVAWLFTVLYAISDELHQSFVPGRSASLWDVVIFDNLGALLALWLGSLSGVQPRPDSGWSLKH